MSFGWSGGDVFLLTQLAWHTLQNSRKACGEYDELTRETLRLHAVLQRLEQEVAKPGSLINRPGESSKEQLERIATDCEVVLKQVDKIVSAYATLSDDKRSVRKIWQRVRFGNGQMADLGDLRSKLTLYTTEMVFYLNLVSMSTVGRIEHRMLRDGGVLRDIKIAVEKTTAHTVLCGGNREGSVLTKYTDDDTGFWKGLRRDLIKDGQPSRAINKHKHLIKKYIKELGDRGILDDHSSQAFNQQEYGIHANSEIMEEVQELPNGFTASFTVIETLDDDVDAELLEDVNEQCPRDSLDDTQKNDTERESSRADSYAPVLQTMGEQSYEIADELGIRSGAKIKSQPCSSSSSLRELQESTHIGDKPQNVPSTHSVLSKHAKGCSQTSMDEANTTCSDTENADDAEGGAGQEHTAHDASSLDVLSSPFHTELCIDFFVTPSGICHKRRRSLLHANISSLCEGFRQRINVMLECLPDRCVPDYSLQSPQTVPGNDPLYTADVQILAKFARSAQEIIRDIGNLRHDPPTSLIDFRSEDSLNAPKPATCLCYKHTTVQRTSFVRIHNLIEDFDWQCYDAVYRLRQCTSRKSFAYTHHPTTTNSPPMHKDASVSVPNQEHPPHIHFDGTGGGTPTTSGYRCSKCRGGRSRKRNSDGSFSSKREPYRSAPSPEPKHPSMRRSETIPVDRKRPSIPVALKSWNLENMKELSDTRDGSSSESGTGDYCPPPRPKFNQQKISQPLPKLRNPSIRRSETMPIDRPVDRRVPLTSSNLKKMTLIQKATSRQTSERPSMSFRGVRSSNKQSSRFSKLSGEAVPNDKVRKTYKYSHKTTDDDEPRQSSSKDPPHLQEVPIRSDVGSSTYEATLSRPSQPNSASKKIREAFFDFHSEYSVECTMFKQHPPLDEDDRKKLHTRLSEMITQHVLLKLDAVETEDEVLKNKKKRLTVDAQNALEQLDRVMKAT